MQYLLATYFTFDWMFEHVMKSCVRSLCYHVLLALKSSPGLEMGQTDIVNSQPDVLITEEEVGIYRLNVRISCGGSHDIRLLRIVGVCIHQAVLAGVSSALIG
jgi:hypothetical protein